MSKKGDGQSKRPSTGKAKYTSKGLRRSSICTHDYKGGRFINMRALKHVKPMGQSPMSRDARIFFGPYKYDTGHLVTNPNTGQREIVFAAL